MKKRKVVDWDKVKKTESVFWREGKGAKEKW